MVKVDSGQYRCEIESSFSKFAYDGSSWVITDKSGTKYYFGQTSSSRQDYGSKVFKWSLDRVEDSHKNYLTISYTKEDSQLYPLEINYTGNSNNSQEPAYSIEFSYESRSDTIINYRPGFKVTTAKRLNEIKVKYQDEQVRRYVLSYTASQNSRSLLSSVKISARIIAQAFRQSALNINSSLKAGSPVPPATVCRHIPVLTLGA